MFKGDLTIRDTLTNLIPGLILLLYSSMFLSEIFNLNISKIYDNEILVTIFGIIVSYTVGFSLRGIFSIYIKYYSTGFKNKFISFILYLIIGKSKKIDLRREYFVENPKIENVVEKKLNIKGLDKNNGLFYFVKFYVKNYASDSNLFEIERNLISFTMASKLISVFFIGFILTISVLIFKLIDDFTILDIKELILLSIISIIMCRINWKLFTSVYDRYVRDIIRVFMTTKE